MIKAIKRMMKETMCKHDYIRDGRPYLMWGGSTKLVRIRCVKCGKVTCADIFTRFYDKRVREANEEEK